MRQRFFNLRVKLLEHDMTQEEAAKIAGISPSAMVNRMSGRYPFDAWEMRHAYNWLLDDGMSESELEASLAKFGLCKEDLFGRG